MRTGTSHFVSLQKAAWYYAQYEKNPVAVVQRKILAGEIHIGKPDLPLGHRIILIDDGCRYGIEEIPEISKRCVGDLPAGESE